MLKKLIFIITLLFLPMIINAQTKIIVGASSTQIPFCFKDGTGLIKDVTDAMNTIQKDYIFTFKPYPPQRLRKEILSGYIHIAAFNNIRWNYDSAFVDTTYNIIYSKDLYIALSTKDHDQSFFKNVGKVKTIVVLGFHYKYAGFTTNQDTLKQNYNTVTTFSEPNVINMVLKKRAEIGVVSSSLLKYTNHINQSQYDSLLISEIPDTKYSRHYLVSKKAPITADILNQIFIKLQKDGYLKRIYSKYGLEAPKIPN